LFNHANLSLCSKKYGTPLHIAAKLNHKYIAQILINHGCPLEIVNDEGETALHILCRKGYSDMLDMIIDLLNYDICKIKEPNEGNTALHVAAIENKENIVRLLVKRFKRLILVKNNKGYTPLLYVPYKVRKSILNSYVESQIRIKGFSSLINNEETSDITLISSDGKQIYSHKIMLWSRWPNIRNKLENKEEKQLLSIDMNYQSLFEFLNYLYDDQLKYIDYSEIVLQQLRDFSIKENLPRLTTLVNIKLNKGGIVPLSTFQEDMIRALNNPLFSDMKIENENSSFFVHKAILVNRSEYFKAMFSKHSSSLRESKKKMITMRDISDKSLQALLNFIYAWQISNINGTTVTEVLEIGNRMMIKELMIYCEYFLLRRINVENVLNMFEIANGFNRTFLKEEALDFISRNFIEVKGTGDWNKTDQQYREEILKFL